MAEGPQTEALSGSETDAVAVVVFPVRRGPMHLIERGVAQNGSLARHAILEMKHAEAHEIMRAREHGRRAAMVEIVERYGPTVGGELMRMWTSVAPADRIMPTIFREVVPRTIESSTTTTRLPARTSRTGESLSFTPKCRICCEGSMKVRPM